MGGGRMDAQPKLIEDRAQALRTCPAQAPDPWDLRADEQSRAEFSARSRLLEPVIAVARAELDRLPESQRGELWLDLKRSRVVVQVTSDAGGVQTRFRDRVEDPRAVVVEHVRYSSAQLQRWADVITAMIDLGWTTVGCGGANNRVDVGVRGPADVAWRRIAAAVDPCAFRVEGGVEVVPLDRDMPDS